MTSTPPILPIAASSCLLGERTRYDGGDQARAALQQTLEALGPIEWLPVCPEVGCGMSVPREPIHVEVAEIADVAEADDSGFGSSAYVVLGNNTAQDHSAALRQFAHAEISRLQSLGVCGFWLKSKSPSCGLIDTPLFSQEAVYPSEPLGYGSGIFARVLQEIVPELPVIDERRLQDDQALRAFFDAALAYQRSSGK